MCPEFPGEPEGEPEFSLVAEKKECSGSETHKGRFVTVEECALSCKEVASMFIFGTNNFGTTRCNTNGCKCYCETSAQDDGSCNVINHNGYLLYKYE